MPIYTKVFLCTSLHRPRKSMETRRWSIESYDQLRERISGAVQQKQLLVEAAKKEIQDEEKKNMLSVAPLESLVTEYYDGEHWVMLTCEDEFLEALRVKIEQNSDLLMFRVGPAKIFKKCHGMGIPCGGHRRRWWLRRASGEIDENPARISADVEESADESSDEKEQHPEHAPFSPFGMRGHKWAGRRHHHHCHRRHQKDVTEKQEDQAVPEEPATAFPRWGKHCRGGRKWRKWLERHQQRAEECKEEPKDLQPAADEQAPQEAQPEQVAPVVEQKEQSAPVLSVNAPESAAPEAPEPTQWTDAHHVLHSMGFTNWKLNEHLLVHHRGNVAQVVTALLKLNV